MKRDMDLIRALLLKLEAEATDRGFSFNDGEAETLKRTLDEVRYNLQQAEQMGLIDVGWKPLTGEWKILQLTPKGHDFLERGQNTERPLMNALKEPERITLAEGLKLLESHLPAAEAKAQLRQAFIRRSLTQSEEPLFTLPYDKSEIDWATGSVKIPGTRRFCPTFGRTEFNSYFFEDHAAAKQVSEEPRKDRLIVGEKQPELSTPKLGVWSTTAGTKMALDWNGVLEKVVVGVIVAAVLGFLALFWNWGSQGGLVHVLGGVTSKEVEDLIKKQAIPAPLNLPSGAVVAFDLPNGCPAGWVVVDSAIERAIVGAATKASADTSKYSDFPWEGVGYKPSIVEHGPLIFGTKTTTPLPVLEHFPIRLRYTQLRRNNFGNRLA